MASRHSSLESRARNKQIARCPRQNEAAVEVVPQKDGSVPTNFTDEVNEKEVKNFQD